MLQQHVANSRLFKVRWYTETHSNTFHCLFSALLVSWLWQFFSRRLCVCLLPFNSNALTCIAGFPSTSQIPNNIIRDKWQYVCLRPEYLLLLLWNTSFYYVRLDVRCVQDSEYLCSSIWVDHNQNCWKVKHRRQTQRQRNIVERVPWL